MKNFSLLLSLLLAAALQVSAGVLIHEDEVLTIGYDLHTLSRKSSGEAFRMAYLSFEARIPDLESETDYDILSFTPYVNGGIFSPSPGILIGNALKNKQFNITVGSKDWARYTYLLVLDESVSDIQLAILGEVYDTEIRNLHLSTCHYEDVVLLDETFARLKGVGTVEAPVSLKTPDYTIDPRYTDVPGWTYHDQNMDYEEGVLNDSPITACGYAAPLLELSISLRTPVIEAGGLLGKLTLEYDTKLDDISVAPESETTTWIMQNAVDLTGSKVTMGFFSSPACTTTKWERCRTEIDASRAERFYLQFAPCGYDALYFTNFVLRGEKLIIDAPDKDDAIRSTQAEPVCLGIYDMSGRKLAAPQRGINIINGKKVVR